MSVLLFWFVYFTLSWGGGQGVEGEGGQLQQKKFLSGREEVSKICSSRPHLTSGVKPDKIFLQKFVLIFQQNILLQGCVYFMVITTL